MSKYTGRIRVKKNSQRPKLLAIKVEDRNKRPDKLNFGIHYRSDLNVAKVANNMLRASTGIFRTITCNCAISLSLIARCDAFQMKEMLRANESFLSFLIHGVHHLYFFSHLRALLSVDNSCEELNHSKNDCPNSIYK